MRLRVALLTVLAVFLGSRVSADDWSLPNISKQVLRLESATEGGGKGTCSSVIFAPGYALTAGHCVGKDVDVTIDGRYAVVYRSNRLLDLAVIKFTPHASDMIVPLGKTPERGREVAIVGYAFAKRDPTATFGRVAVPVDEDGYLVLNADVLQGQSGCPVIDRKGHLIGITSAIQFNGPAHLGLAVTIDTVTDFVSDLLPPKVPKAKP